MGKTRRVYLVHSDVEVLAKVVDKFESEELRVLVCMNSESLLHQMETVYPEAILLGEQLLDCSSLTLCQTLRTNALLQRVPVFMLSEGTAHSAELIEGMGRNIDGVISTARRTFETYGELIERFRRARFDPVTGLPAGALPHRMLEYLCDSAPFAWTFVMVKLFGVRIYNFQKGYEEGDRMLAETGAVIEQAVEESGAAGDFTARLSGCRFCVATRTRKAETICGKILNYTDRSLRRFYSPFELVKGYMTVEHEKVGGHYHLAETMIAGLQIPSHWNGHVTMLKDLAREMIADLEKSEKRMEIVAMK